jgi:hypothetical protein
MTRPALQTDSFSDQFYYDDVTGELTWKTVRAQSRSKPGDRAGYVSTIGGRRYKLVGIGRKTHVVGRVVAAMFLGLRPEQQVEYLDGDATNTRIENLKPKQRVS